MDSALTQGAIAFTGGALYEAAAVVWVRQSERGAAFKAALASVVCASCMLAGVGESIHGGLWPSLGFVLGWGFGTFASVWVTHR